MRETAAFLVGTTTSLRAACWVLFKVESLYREVLQQNDIFVEFFDFVPSGNSVSNFIKEQALVYKFGNFLLIKKWDVFQKYLYSFLTTPILEIFLGDLTQKNQREIKVLN
ncbi:hypothetical protein M0811_07464 [Anaeramoeba ignava]|uniref:Uncharacterized protein n=1 Tax=Anaeramoeba ignava TaxID=1746090 RepID=A0A9Q0LPE8_ANAIG|nr:hypothetical protein M0811_07464 [Anaeramoeba ignava]